MNTSETIGVEFQGGPLDGFEFTTTTATIATGRRLALPINTNIVRIVSGEPPTVRSGATSVAVYELTEFPLSRVYQYVGPADVGEFLLNDWSG